MSDPKYPTYIDDPNTVDPLKTEGRTAFTPDELVGDDDEPLQLPDVLVQIVNKLLTVRFIPADRIAVGQGQIGGSGQQAIMELVGRQETRQTITLVNTGTVQWEFSGDSNLQANNGFPLSAGASYSDLPYRGPVFARLTTAGTPGTFAWVATLIDGSGS